MKKQTGKDLCLVMKLVLNFCSGSMCMIRNRNTPGNCGGDRRNEVHHISCTGFRLYGSELTQCCWMSCTISFDILSCYRTRDCFAKVEKVTQGFLHIFVVQSVGWGDLKDHIRVLYNLMLRE